MTAVVRSKTFGLDRFNRSNLYNVTDDMADHSQFKYPKLFVIFGVIFPLIVLLISIYYIVKRCIRSATELREFREEHELRMTRLERLNTFVEDSTRRNFRGTSVSPLHVSRRPQAVVTPMPPPEAEVDASAATLEPGTFAPSASFGEEIFVSAESLNSGSETSPSPSPSSPNSFVSFHESLVSLLFPNCGPTLHRYSGPLETIQEEDEEEESEMDMLNDLGISSRYHGHNTETFFASTAKDRIVFADPEGGVNQTKLTVLGYEETWQNSSLLLCESEVRTPPVARTEPGVIIMSQVHLELGAVEGLEHEGILRKSESLRKEIVRDILSEFLKMEVAEEAPPSLDYTYAYFLGMHDAKTRFIEQIRYSIRNGILKIGPMEVKFIGHDEEAPNPSRYMLPVYMFQCPRDFSTVEYFENLGSLYVGRLVIYAEVLSSSMDIVNAELANGLAVVATQQTAGKGRSSNQWLSPPGCTMFSLQLHFPVDSYLGSHPTILQHIVAIAVVSSLSEMSPDYKNALDLHVKWPNDIYHGDSIKLGGLIATCLQNGNNLVVNIGCGINLNNEAPTTCLNRIIKQYNEKNNKKVPELSRELLLATVFTEVERLIAVVQGGQMHVVEHMYYHHWLHSGAKVRIRNHSNEEQQVTIHGIDEFGFLEVRDDKDNVFTVHPDGNTFDMMEGLIAPRTR